MIFKAMKTSMLSCSTNHEDIKNIKINTNLKSYNVLNYNNCSTDWSFPLNEFVVHVNSAPSMTLSLVYANTDLYDVVILPINTALLTTLWVILIQTL
jgi:hypothetical protein